MSPGEPKSIKPFIQSAVKHSKGSDKVYPSDSISGGSLDSKRVIEFKNRLGESEGVPREINVPVLYSENSSDDGSNNMISPEQLQRRPPLIEDDHSQLINVPIAVPTDL